MNPLNSNPFNSQAFNNANNQLLNNVRQVKQVMNSLRGDPNALAQQFPQLKPFIGGNLQNVYMQMCQDRGVDPNVILNELRS